MRLLVVGGTQFVGRAFVEAAARRGHAVTVFHRGHAEPPELADVEHVHGDRGRDLARLRGRRWDALLDTHAYVPRDVTDLAAAVGEAVSHATLVSSTSAYPLDVPPGADERAPVVGPPFPATEEVTDDTYGPLKVACERAAEAAWRGRCLIVRPGYIVGPNDPTDRFLSHLRRAAAGGERLAPGPPDAPLQAVDVRDLATFMLDRIEAADAGVYNVVGPGEPLTTRGLYEVAREVAGATTRFRWVDEDRLRAQGPEVERWLPMWEPWLAGAHAVDGRRAVAAGLRHRPFAETVADTLRWDAGRGGPPLACGLPDDVERALLAAV